MYSQGFEREFLPLPNEEVDDRTKRAIEIFRKVAKRALEKNWQYAVLSGFAIDAYLGYLSRNHKDVNFIIDKKDIDEVKAFLEQEGHVVCVSKKYGRNLLRVDPIDVETTRAGHGDIHISFFDQATKEIVVPMLDKEIRFKGDYNDISMVKEFLGVKARVLLPDLILKEKKDWREKFGFDSRAEKNELEQAKILRIIALMPQEAPTGQ